MAAPFVYRTKAFLLQAKPTLATDPAQQQLLLACDTTDRGSKAYAWFPSFTELHQYAVGVQGGTLPSLYEIIYKPDIPVFAYFDVDRDVAPHDVAVRADPVTYKQALLRRILDMLQRLLAEHYDAPGIPLVVGRTVQVCTTSNPDKVSLHVRVNMPCTQGQAKVLAESLASYAAAHCQDGEEWSTWWCDPKKGKCVVDGTVYSNFRAFRLLGSTKMGKVYPLVPFEGSSGDVADHMVVRHPELERLLLARAGAGIGQGCYIDPPAALATAVPFLADASNQPSGRGRMAVPLDAEQAEGLERTVRRATAAQVQRALGGADELPPGELDNVRATLNALPELRALLHAGTGRALLDGEARHTYPGYTTFPITRGLCCPYTVRTGSDEARAHSGNGSYVTYNHTTKVAALRCHNTDCQAAYACGRAHAWRLLDPSGRCAAARNELRAHSTLHDRADDIQWGEDYSEDAMRDYDLSPGRITCVRANMGIGKTNKLLDQVEEFCAAHPAARCLVLTFSRTLARKYHARLAEPAGFVNYLDRTGPIPDPRVIVCLDSLTRIRTDSFDLVLIDEALSVFLHMGSPFLAPRVCSVTWRLQLVLLQAQRLFLLDAAVDNALCHDVVRYVQSVNKHRELWVRNRFVRPTNRTVRIITSAADDNALLRLRAVRHILGLLGAGRRVVVACTCKSFTKLLAAEIEEALPDVRFALYNSESDKEAVAEAMADPEAVWPQYQAVVYSPSVGAGISFVRPHFDQLVGWLENSDRSPCIDLALQQLFRARQLLQGQMSLYVADRQSNYAQSLPITQEAVERWLNQDLGHTARYMADVGELCGLSKGGATLGPSGEVSLAYDRSQLSFMVLRGIVTLRHKSLLRFHEILARTLEQDYGIPVEHEWLSIASRADRALLKQLETRRRAAAAAEEVPWTMDLLQGLDAAWYQRRSLARQEHSETGRWPEDLPDTAVERLQEWVYRACVDLWGMPLERCDEEFMTQHVGQATAPRIAAWYEDFFALQRQRTVVWEHANWDAAAQQRDLSLHIESLQHLKDGSLALWQDRVRLYKERLLEGARLLHCLLDASDFAATATDTGGAGPAAKQALAVLTDPTKNGVLFSSRDAIVQAVRCWADGIPPDAWSRVVLTLLDKTALRWYGEREGLLADRNKVKRFVISVTKQVFGMGFVRAHPDVSRDPVYVLTTGCYARLRTHYRPRALLTDQEWLAEAEAATNSTSGSEMGSW